MNHNPGPISHDCVDEARVLVPLDRAPFRDFTAEEFMGDQIFSCRGRGGCRRIFQGSRLTLGQMADACVYVGADAGR